MWGEPVWVLPAYQTVKVTRLVCNGVPFDFDNLARISSIDSTRRPRSSYVCERNATLVALRLR